VFIFHSSVSAKLMRCFTLKLEWISNMQNVLDILLSCGQRLCSVENILSYSSASYVTVECHSVESRQLFVS
jgi:hypothetical protein